MNNLLQAILVGAMLTAAAPLLAQSGRIRIRVMDASNRPIPNAEASVFGKDAELILVEQTNEDGEAVLTGIPAGGTKIRVTSSGFRPLLLTGIQLPSTTELKLDAKLEVGEWPNTSGIKKHKRWWIFGPRKSK